jgi:hypothetical protein
MHLAIICSWCGADMGKKLCEAFNEELPRVTHSICHACKKDLEKDLRKDPVNQSKNNKTN